MLDQQKSPRERLIEISRKWEVKRNTCSCCNRPLFPEADELTVKLRLTGHEKVLFHALVARAGGILSRGSIVDQLWGDRDDGGPEDTDQSINVTICKLRSKLKAKGMGIETRWGQGYRLVRHEG